MYVMYVVLHIIVEVRSVMAIVGIPPTPYNDIDLVTIVIFDWF